MKFKELPTADKSGRALKVENAVVESVALTTADHGLLSGWLHLRFDGGGCGFGGYHLGRADGEQMTSKDRDYAAEFIVRCLKVAGVDEWANIAGQNLRVLHEGLGGGIVAVGHIIRDEWFCPRVEWAKK